MKRGNKTGNVLYLAELSLLTAAVLILQLTGAAIKIPPSTSINLVLLPITLGAILLGPLAGAWLGAVCGVVVYVAGGVMEADFFTFTLFHASPVITALICMVKTTAAGYLSGLLYRLLKGRNAFVATVVAAALVPVTNTGLFILGCFVMMNTITSIAASSGVGFLYFVFILCAGVNFLFEISFNLLLSPALHRVAKVLEKQHRIK